MTASLRLVSSIRAFATKATAMRSTTAPRVAAASMSATFVTRWKWSSTSTPIDASAKATGTATASAPPGSASVVRRGCCHAAQAMSSVEAGHRASRIEPMAYVPSASEARYQLSATAFTARPAPRRIQRRSGRQPFTPKTARTSATRTRSPTGYARFVAIAAPLPSVAAARIGSKRMAAVSALAPSPAIAPSSQVEAATRSCPRRESSSTAA